MTHAEMTNALATAIGVPAENVIPILRAQARALPIRDKEGTLLFHAVGASSTDEALVIEAYRNIETIKRVTGR